MHSDTVPAPLGPSTSKIESDPSRFSSGNKPFPQSQRGRAAGGQPIGELMHQALAYPELISLAAGFVDDATLPVELSMQAWNALQRHPNGYRKSLQYGGNIGDYQLRKEILDFSMRDFPPILPVEPSQVLVTAGSNQLLHLVADALFDVGDIVLTAAPTYFVYIGTLKNMGVRTYGVESDEQGMCPIALQATLDRLELQGEGHRVKGLYLVPYFDNPAGTTIGRERRLEIARILEKWRNKGYNTVLLADYAYQELGFKPTDVPPWRALLASADEYCIELGTFSKSFSPGVRIGWGVFPKGMMEMMGAMKANIDFGSPNFNQQWMLEVLKSGELAGHLERLRAGYGQKRNAMVEACRESFSTIPGVRWYEPDGGLYVWVEMPESLPAGPQTRFYDAAIKNGVLYVPGEYCFPDEGVAKHFSSMRLTFGVQSEDRIRSGIRLLADAMRSLLDC